LPPPILPKVESGQAYMARAGNRDPARHIGTFDGLSQ
jgi:hypothetical protein